MRDVAKDAAVLDTVKRLIAFDTTSRNSNLELIAFAEDIFTRAGGRVQRTYDDARRKANLFATLGPEGDGGYVLSGHTDVVPVDGQEWSSDPFAAEVRGGKLYGRGACDMKGFVGACLALAPEFARLDFKRPLHFAFSYDEEVGCVGVRRLIDDLAQAHAKPALAIIGEPTEMRVVGAHKAGAVIETTAHGREHHSSAPHLGANAVMMAGELIAYLRDLGLELMSDRDEHFDPPYTTVQANMVTGGTAVNILAGEAHVKWECRALPDRDADTVIARVRRHADEVIAPRYRAGAPEAGFDMHVHASYPGLGRDPNSPAVELARRLSGANDVHTVAYGTEAGLFQAAGIPAVICGPGSITQAHRPDEFVALDQLDSCTAFLRKVAQAATT
jgi:acetylornithine deacetylase